MSKKPFYVGIKNEVASNTLELYFTDYIADDLDWSTFEYTNMVQDTIDKIKAANPTTIKLIINSLGGDVMIGLALYNFLKSYNATKEVDIIGFAASIASVIAMCASPGKLRMANPSFMIIHAASSGIYGTADEIQAAAESLRTVTNQLAGIYAQRSGKTAEHFTSLWKDGDYWMTADEAKSIGLVDEVYNAEPMTACINPQDYGFKHTPANLIASVNNPQLPEDFTPTQKNWFMKIVDNLKAAITGAKTDDKNKDIPHRDEILAMVERVLTPIVAQIEEAIPEKPEEAVTTTTETKPVEETTTTVKKETPETQAAPTAEQQKITELENKLNSLSASIATNIAKPTPTPAGGTPNVDAAFQVEYN